MSKTLRTAALIVGAVALVATGVGAFAPAIASSAWAAGSATAFSISAAGATAVSVAAIAGPLATGLTLAASVAAPKPSAASTGSAEQFTADPEGAIPYVIGRVGTSGNIIFRRAWDTLDRGENDRSAFAVVLSGGGPVEAIESFSADKVPTAFDADGRAIGPYGGAMWQKVQLGQIPTPAALTFGTGAGSAPGWGADRRLHGLAAALWTLRYDTRGKLYQNGTPPPKWVVLGVKAYDPRKDSTYPGGSGPHRWADPRDTAAFDAARETWTYTIDPYLQGLRWALGTWERDPAVAGSVYVKTFGMGLPIGGIDVAAFVEGANIARVNGWSAGGVLYSADPKWETLKKILQAGMGEPLMLGAKLSCFVNAPKVSLATVTEADRVGEASVQATQSRRDRINRIVPRYVQEAKDWQLLPGTPVAVPDYYAIDGGQRSKTQDYPLIQSDAQIAVAARYDIENGREFGPIVLPLKLRWLGYKPGDCITADLPELGLDNQTILLLSRDFDPGSGIPTFTARSETPSKHAFALGQTTTPPPTPGISAAPTVPQPGPAAWAITATAIADGASSVPVLKIEGTTDSPVADAAIAEYRPHLHGQAADAGWIIAATLPPTATSYVIAAVQADTAYEIAVSYQRRRVVGPRRILGPVTAGAFLAPGVYSFDTGPLAISYRIDTGGNPTPTYTEGGGTMVLRSGGQPVDGAVYGLADVQGFTGATVNPTTGVYSYTGMSANSASMLLTANVGGQRHAATQVTATKVYDGSAAETGGPIPYPDIGIGGGTTFYPSLISLEPGASLSASASITGVYTTGGGQNTITLTISVRPEGGAFVDIGSGSASLLGPNEPESVAASGSFQNTGSERQLFQVRFVAAGTGTAPKTYSDGIASVSAPGAGVVLVGGTWG